MILLEGNISSLIDPQSNPEWYLWLKHDEKYLYALIDAVSDKEVGRVDSHADRRQAIWFLLSTNNTPLNKIDVGTKDAYFVELHFVSEKKLEGGSILQGIPNPGIILPRKYYKCNWSISGSRLHPDPHIMIETAFDLGLLTKYYNTIFMLSRAWDIYINQMGLEGDLNLKGEVPVPEFPIPWREIVLAGGIGAAVGTLAFHKRRFSKRAFLGLKNKHNNRNSLSTQAQ
jgi:hypothetical protein